MSWRNIQAYYENFTRDEAGIAGLSSNNSVESAYPLDALIDNRWTTKMKFAAAAADHYIDIDLGADHSDTIGELIIPAGHSLDGIAMDLLADTTHPPTTSKDSWTQSGSGVIKRSFTAEAKRYYRLEMDTNGAHEFHQLILTNQKTFTAGPNWPKAPNRYRHSYIRFELPSGITPTLQTGTRRRVLQVDFPLVDDQDATNDLATLRAWIEAVGMHHPFWIDPPSFSATPDADDPATPFKFDDEPDSEWGLIVPLNGIDAQAFTLPLIESVD